MLTLVNLSVSDPWLLRGEGMCVTKHLSKGFKRKKKLKRCILCPQRAIKSFIQSPSGSFTEQQVVYAWILPTWSRPVTQFTTVAEELPPSGGATVSASTSFLMTTKEDRDGSVGQVVLDKTNTGLYKLLKKPSDAYCTDTTQYWK